MELSTRDRVALASYTEIKEGRGTPKGGVWLDVARTCHGAPIMTRLPRVYQTLLDLQMLDITREPIEIAPTAHYWIGRGVGASRGPRHRCASACTPSVRRRAACTAPIACSRNMSIELLVFGRITGRAAAAYSQSLTAQPRSAWAIAEARAEIDDLLVADEPENVRALQRAIRNTMTEHAGVVRDEEGLRAGLAELSVIEKRMADIGVHPDIAGYQDLAHTFDLKSTSPGRPGHSGVGPGTS